MSVNGISSQPVAFPRAAVARPQGTPPGQSGGAAHAEASRIAAQPQSAPAGEPTEALTSAPPEGVDPALWSVLTTEERAYFAKVRALGPLTYGPSAASTRPQVRGGRVDVTV